MFTLYFQIHILESNSLSNYNHLLYIHLCSIENVKYDLLNVFRQSLYVL
jgi:hypothetical protein